MPSLCCGERDRTERPDSWFSVVEFFRLISNPLGRAGRPALRFGKMALCFSIDYQSHLVRCLKSHRLVERSSVLAGV